MDRRQEPNAVTTTEYDTTGFPVNTLVIRDTTTVVSSTSGQPAKAIGDVVQRVARANIEETKGEPRAVITERSR